MSDGRQRPLHGWLCFWKQYPNRKSTSAKLEWDHNLTKIGFTFLFLFVMSPENWNCVCNWIALRLFDIKAMSSSKWLFSSAVDSNETCFALPFPHLRQQHCRHTFKKIISPRQYLLKQWFSPFLVTTPKIRTAIVRDPYKHCFPFILHRKDLVTPSLRSQTPWELLDSHFEQNHSGFSTAVIVQIIVL